MTVSVVLYWNGLFVIALIVTHSGFSKIKSGSSLQPVPFQKTWVLPPRLIRMSEEREPEQRIFRVTNMSFSAKTIPKKDTRRITVSPSNALFRNKIKESYFFRDRRVEGYRAANARSSRPLIIF